MNLYRIIEIWDSILFSLLNIPVRVIYWWRYRSLRSCLVKNQVYKNKHAGERCFIVLNGPSLNEYDLSLLENEIVFATNYFFKAPICQIVNPNYYCWLDAKVFSRRNVKEVMDELFLKCPNSKMILNEKGYKILGDNKNISYVYTRHIPNFFTVKNDLTGLMSNFSTVAFLAITSAIYMGFKDIYILGLDFEPGGFKHFTDLSSNCIKPNDKILKEEVCGLHAGYSKAQYESYYVAEFAQKNGCNIYNLNPNSCIRAFQFANYNDVMIKS